MLKKQKQEDCRAVFSRLTEMLCLSGRWPDCTETETDFALRLAKAVPAVSPKEAERFTAAVNAAAFDSSAPNRHEQSFCRQICRRCAADIYAGLSRKNG